MKELLNQIAAAPDDDAPRKVLADLLNERGDWRAELIAVQLKRSSSADRALRAREKELLERAGAEWLPGAHAIRFERGLPAELTIGARAIADQGDAFFERAAGLRSLTLRLAGAPVDVGLVALRAVLQSRALALRHLAVSWSEPDARVVDALRAVHLDSLEVDLPGDGVASLLHAEVRTLSMTGVTGAALDRELSRPCALRGLRLTSCRLTAAEAEALLSTPQLPELTELALVGCELTAASVHALRHPRLTTLDLSENLAGPALAAAVVNAAPAGVRELHLARTRVGDEGAALLANSPWAAGLRRLGLRGTTITDSGAEALAASPYLRNLEWLNLNGNAIGQPVKRQLAAMAAKVYVDGSVPLKKPAR